ncbi:arginase family protein [Draconibacterium sp. IB214405]|uniref:arginase family protein n=1 Tax=Draconibacterium sp. IB214405 TaxID=3097352 RepID=UPI002A105C22|nr:arginase family protein [Draconibacterium sp. IB214405]MDX8337684.1 arginase family protein [Draconibacterium sp. IB214405]
MNLFPYFDAVDFSQYVDDVPFAWKYSVGATIEKNTLKLQEGRLKNIELAIVGVPFNSEDDDFKRTTTPDSLRRAFYSLAGVGKLNIIDFGNLKASSSHKGNYLALRDVVDYLSELGIVTIILGGSQDYSYGVCQAFRSDPFFSFCSVDAFLDVKKGVESLSPENYLSQVFKTIPDLFQFSLLAYQSHYVPEIYFEKTKGIGPHVRLGKLRDDWSSAEPVFRNCDFLSFDMCALKHSEAPNKNLQPNGLYADEACQLMKLAGASNRMKVFGLFGMEDQPDEESLTVNLAAQLVWYFIQGYLIRDKRKPEQGDGFSTFSVEIAELSAPLVFCKNETTGQWWIRVQAINNEIKYFACSEKDYQNATDNEIPEIWLKYVQKTDELLK